MTEFSPAPYSCPYCKKTLPEVSLLCSHCGRDLEEWIKLEHIDPKDVRTLKAVLSESIKRYVWQRTLTVVASGGLLFTAANIGWTIYEKSKLEQVQSAKDDADSRARDLQIKSQVDDRLATSLKAALASAEKDLQRFEAEVEKQRDRMTVEIDRVRERATSQLDHLTKSATEADINLRAKTNDALVIAERLRTSFEDSEEKGSLLKKNFVEFQAARVAIDTSLKGIHQGLQENRENLQKGENALISYRERTDRLRTTLATEEQKIQQLIDRLEVQRQQLDAAAVTIDRQREALANAVTYDALRTIVVADNQEHAIEQAQAAQSAPRISLVRPFSLSETERKVVLGSTVRLEWFFPRTLPPENKYVIEVSGAQNFPAVSTLRFNRPLSSLELPYEQVKSRLVGNTVYWRVAQIAQQEPSEPVWSEVGVFDYYPSTYDRIRLTGRLRVGISSTYDGGFASVDRNGELKGFEIEFCRKLAADLLASEGRALQVEFVPYDWLVLLSSLKDYHVDILAATISIRTSRESTFGLRFTQPYFKSSNCLVYSSDEPPSDFMSLGDRVIAAQKDTVNVSIAQERSSSVREVSSTAAALEEVAAGRAFAAVMDTPFAQHQIPLKNLQGRLAFEVLKVDNYGVAVPSGEETLLRRLNELIERYESSGYFRELERRTLKGETVVATAN